jgi:hypothetical protein
MYLNLLSKISLLLFSLIKLILLLQSIYFKKYYRRFDAQTGADREVQRVLIELLNQMDGF